MFERWTQSWYVNCWIHVHCTSLSTFLFGNFLNKKLKNKQTNKQKNQKDSRDLKTFTILSKAILSTPMSHGFFLNHKSLFSKYVVGVIRGKLSQIPTFQRIRSKGLLRLKSKLCLYILPVLQPSLLWALPCSGQGLGWASKFRSTLCLKGNACLQLILCPCLTLIPALPSVTFPPC